MIDDLNISLNQGKKFILYQTKIKKNKKKEGFVLNNESQSDLNELTKLQSKYDDLIKQYTNIQQKIVSSSLDNINRVSKNNPYLNKLIRFTNGYICYVTNMGVVKYIGSPEILETLPNNKNIINVDIPWDDSYNTPGIKIPTNPSLISGTNVQQKEILGNEGLNVYVSSLLPTNISPAYLGCYSANQNNDNMTFIGNKPESYLVSIINGNFEQPTISNNSYKYISDSITIPGWDVKAILLNNSNSWDFPIPYPKGNQCISIQGLGHISQNIKLDINYNYTLNFYACGRDCCMSPNLGNPIDIDLYDNNMVLIKNIYNFTPSVNEWTYYSFDFNVTSYQTYRIYFSGKTTEGDRSTAIQGINIVIGNYSVGDYSFDDCKNAAIEQGYKYFALQNVNSSTSNGYCAVSNSEPAITQYGLSKVPSKMIELWSSNTSGQSGNTAILRNTGSLQVINLEGKSVYSSIGGNPSNYLGCYNDCYLGRGLPTLIGNGQNYDSCQLAAKSGNWLYFGLQNTQPNGTSECWVGNDMSKGISMGKANNCTITNDINLGGGCSNAIYYNETNETTLLSNYFLILQDDGNMCVFRGTGPNDNQGLIWETKTTGKQQLTNPEMVASKGKYGKNWITQESTLSPGDFIGSNDGKIALVMENNGNLVLYAYQTESNCVKISNNKIGGGVKSNAVYDIGKVGFPKNLGLLGYVNSDSKLSQYPDSMTEFTNYYDMHLNSDSFGNDITSSVVSNQKDCETSCNNNSNCAAFVYQDFSKTCWLKNNMTYPKSEKQNSTTSVLGVRKKQIKSSNTCSNKIVEIDTIQFENYTKNENTNIQCEKSYISQNDKIKFDNIKSQLIILGKEIVNKMEKYIIR